MHKRIPNPGFDPRRTSAVFRAGCTVFCYFCAFFSFLLNNNSLFKAMFCKLKFLTLLTMFLGATALSAQTPTPKYGHMNLGNLLESLPETKKANDDLKVFADKLTAIDDSLAKSFQAAYAQLEKEYNAGELTPVQAQKRQEELQKQQAYIQKFEEDAQQQVAQKRDELLQPILDKVDAAVKAVAKENGYLMIFDTSSGAMLFAANTEDVTELVKKKMAQ